MDVPTATAIADRRVSCLSDLNRHSDNCTLQQVLKDLLPTEADSKFSDTIELCLRWLCAGES